MVAVGFRFIWIDIWKAFGVVLAEAYNHHHREVMAAAVDHHQPPLPEVVVGGTRLHLTLIDSKS